jgi:integrase/recombinase XerD
MATSLVPSRSPQFAKRVNLLKKIKVGDAWRFAPAVPESNGKLKDKVLVDGAVEVHPEGSYFIEWRENGRRRRESVEKEEALDRARRKAVEVQAQRDGLIQAAPPPTPAENSENGRVKTGEAIDLYLKFIKAHRKSRTYLTYRFTLDVLLRTSFTKPYIDQVTREDLIQFMTDCYERGLGKRTVYDKLVVVLQLFKRYGKSGLLQKSDWPEYVETIRPIYEAEELEAMFKAATEDEATLLKFLVGSGLRDQEVRFLLWRDIDFRHNLVRVTAKPQWEFTPKNWEERAVPLPEGLMQRLRALKERRNGVPAHLVFPSSRGNPDSAMDEIVKRVARRAKLNCGMCETKHGNRCSEGPYCSNFFLHKFRHTFATEHLRHGVDIRTLQSWMGHRDIKSTMVYLKGVQSKDALTKVNAGSLARYVN